MAVRQSLSPRGALQFAICRTEGLVRAVVLEPARYHGPWVRPKSYSTRRLSSADEACAERRRRHPKPGIKSARGLSIGRRRRANLGSPAAAPGERFLEWSLGCSRLGHDYRPAVANDAQEQDGGLSVARQHEAFKESSGLLFGIGLKGRREDIGDLPLRGIPETRMLDINCPADCVGACEPSFDVPSE